MGWLVLPGSGVGSKVAGRRDTWTRGQPGMPGASPGWGSFNQKGGDVSLGNLVSPWFNIELYLLEVGVETQKCTLERRLFSALHFHIEIRELSAQTGCFLLIRMNSPRLVRKRVTPLQVSFVVSFFHNQGWYLYILSIYTVIYSIYIYIYMYIHIHIYIYMSNSLTIFLQIQRVASFFFPKHRILFSSHLSKAEVIPWGYPASHSSPSMPI